MESLFGTGPGSPLMGLALLLSLAAVISLGALGAARAAHAATANAKRTGDTLLHFVKDHERIQLMLREQVNLLQVEVGRLREEVGRVRDSTGVSGVAVAPPPPPPPPVSAPSRDEPPRLPPALAVAPDEATIMVTRTPTQVETAPFHGLPLLRVVAGPDLGREFKLPFERSTIGRAGNNRVVLSEERASRTHAELRYEGGRFVLKDSGSTNGTQRNGKPAGEETLEFGDRIAIGGTEMVFTSEGFDLKGEDPGRAITAFERMLERESNFITALQNLAFLLERDVARKREAEGVWKRLNKLGQ